MKDFARAGAEKGVGGAREGSPNAEHPRRDREESEGEDEAEGHRRRRERSPSRDRDSRDDDNARYPPTAC